MSDSDKGSLARLQQNVSSQQQTTQNLINAINRQKERFELQQEQSDRNAADARQTAMDAAKEMADAAQRFAADFAIERFAGDVAEIYAQVLAAYHQRRS